MSMEEFKNAIEINPIFSHRNYFSLFVDVIFLYCIIILNTALN